MDDDANGEIIDRGKDGCRSRSVVKIECGPNEGTAVCVHSSEADGRQIFLTCAHVVRHKAQSVILRYDGRVLNGRAVYATRKGVPHDIAVVVGERRTADVVPCTMSDGGGPTVGQAVFAVGCARERSVPWSVPGNVHKKSLGLFSTTCNVHVGFSGGPVFTSDGRLLGLTVGKLSVGAVNFVIPSTEFAETVESYVLTNDVKVLDNLESKCPLRKMLWNDGIPNLNVYRL